MTRIIAAGSAAFLWLGISSAMADGTVTITTTSTTCQVAPPAEVAAPVTPNSVAGSAAIKNHNYALARANFKPLAEKGDAEAERLYGALLMQKCTGIQDEAAGASWLQKAADGGDVIAQTQLGQAYMNGQGVAQDDNKAFLYLSKAAAAGQGQGEVSLGYLYLTGRGVPVDKYQGMVWTVKAGEQGLPVALSNIAHGYFKGEALPQDNERAVYFIVTAMQRATPQQRTRFQDNINSITRAISVDDLKRYADRARHWSPGKGSLDDVLEDAARTRSKVAKN